MELIGRRRMLHKVLKKVGPVLRFSDNLSAEQGDGMFRHACAMGLEGIVSKKLTSRYKSGACKSWLKVKNPAYARPVSARYRSRRASHFLGRALSCSFWRSSRQLQGAEIVAGGSIQVYGTLRGRARLEGVKNAPQRRSIEVP